MIQDIDEESNLHPSIHPLDPHNCYTEEETIEMRFLLCFLSNSSLQLPAALLLSLLVNFAHGFFLLSPTHERFVVAFPTTTTTTFVNKVNVHTAANFPAQSTLFASAMTTEEDMESENIDKLDESKLKQKEVAIVSDFSAC